MNGDGRVIVLVLGMVFILAGVKVAFGITGWNLVGVGLIVAGWKIVREC